MEWNNPGLWGFFHVRSSGQVNVKFPVTNTNTHAECQHLMASSERPITASRMAPDVLYVFLYVCIHMYKYTCTCIYMCMIHIYIYVCIHVYEVPIDLYTYGRMSDLGNEFHSATVARILTKPLWKGFMQYKDGAFPARSTQSFQKSLLRKML